MVGVGVKCVWRVCTVLPPSCCRCVEGVGVGVGAGVNVGVGVKSVGVECVWS